MLKIYASNTNSYEALTGKSLAMFLLKDGNYIYLLRGTTVSPYMSEQLYNDVEAAIDLGFTLSEIADLFDKSKSLELLGTTIETYEKFSNDSWNWHKWSLNRHFCTRFWTYISEGVHIRKI